MRSAQRRLRLEKDQKTKVKSRSYLKVVVFLCILVLPYLFLKITTKHWDGVNKVPFVYQYPSGDVGIKVLDPLLDEETTLIIPGNTEVEVARGYGTLKLKNVWQLSINEKLEGKLLTETVTNNFLFPSMLWSSEDLGQSIKFVFSPNSTNISFGDRVYMTFFAMRVKSIDKTEINLGKSQFLKEKVLADGEKGYVVNGPISGRLTVYFSDNLFATQNKKFGLVDLTGVPGVANHVGTILEVLGGKVVSVEKGAVSDSDCEVLGQNKDAIKKISRLFSCKNIDGESNFDMEMRMGAAFSTRF